MPKIQSNTACPTKKNLNWNKLRQPTDDNTKTTRVLTLSHKDFQEAIIKLLSWINEINEKEENLNR